jgi:hypothetical protein
LISWFWRKASASTAEITELARRHIEETAARISDPEIRRSYINDVPAHARMRLE